MNYAHYEARYDLMIKEIIIERYNISIHNIKIN